MRAEGLGDAVDRHLRPLLRAVARGRVGDVARERHRARRGSAHARRPARGRPGDRRHRGRAQAQRRPGHEHGHDQGEVADRRQGGRDLPRHRRRPGARAARALRRAGAARAHELLRHARRLAGGAAPPSRDRVRRPARLPAEQGAEDRRRHACSRSRGSATRRWNGHLPAMATSTRRSSPRGCSTRCSSTATATPSSRTPTTSAPSSTRASSRGWRRRSLPFAMEVAGRTEADRKGGHIARLRDDGLVLRETAQTPEEDLASLQDVGRHRYVNTNNLWVDLEALRATLQERDGVLGLPIIVNRKTVDPSDSDSTGRSSSSRRRWAPRSASSRALARCTSRGGASRRSRRPTTCSRCARTPTCCTRTTASSSRPSARSRRSSTSTPTSTSSSATSSRASRAARRRSWRASASRCPVT